jgi:DNA ligase (NAD+)
LHNEEYEALNKWGIGTNPHGRVVKDFDGVLDFYGEWEKKRDKLDYEFDGTVISVNDNDIYRRAGIVGKSPRGAIAFKFVARQAETIVEDIQVQVGRTGVLTPVAHLKPVHIGGTTITRATLHNLDEIKRLGVRIGDTVIVGRAGDVIPDIIKVLPELRPHDSKEFHMPKKCPVCEQPIQQVQGKVAYYCPNRDCPAQKRESIYHFISRNAMNIDGVGPSTIDALMDAGLISDYADLYILTKDDILNLERFGEVSAQNTVNAIRARMKVQLHRFIFALGIEHVGEETARVLAQQFHTIDKLREASPEELEQVPDVGPTVAKSIYDWFAHSYNQKLLDKFKKAGVRIEPAKEAPKGKLSGKTFVVTGTLDSMSREEAEEKIRVHGGKVASSVSKETDYVVVGANPGDSKMKSAQKLGTKKLGEQEFLKMIE